MTTYGGFSQTLSSLALVFALHHYKPTPLYVMDEIDAALGKSRTRLLFLTVISQIPKHPSFSTSAVKFI
jgi:hypothetical protein